MDTTSTGEEESTFNLLDENIVGFPDDRLPQHGEVVRAVGLLEEAGIPCCFVGEYALIYYGAGRVQNDRYLCVSDEQHNAAVRIFKAHPEMFVSVRPSPVQDRLRLLPLFPRFKYVDTTDFWVILPASFAHVSCEPSAIEKSLGGLPYPNPKNYVESLLDTQNGTDLEDLIDAMDLSEEWAEENIDLDREIDIEWAEQQLKKQRDLYGKKFYPLSVYPRPRRYDWERLVRNKVLRLAFKKSPETHATRWRRHRSRDPRSRPRDLI